MPALPLPLLYRRAALPGAGASLPACRPAAIPTVYTRWRRAPPHMGTVRCAAQYRRFRGSLPAAIATSALLVVAAAAALHLGDAPRADAFAYIYPGGDLDKVVPAGSCDRGRFMVVEDNLSLIPEGGLEVLFDVAGEASQFITLHPTSLKLTADRSKNFTTLYVSVPAGTPAQIYAGDITAQPVTTTSQTIKLRYSFNITVTADPPPADKDCTLPDIPAPAPKSAPETSGEELARELAQSEPSVQIVDDPELSDSPTREEQERDDEEARLAYEEEQRAAAAAAAAAAAEDAGLEAQQPETPPPVEPATPPPVEPATPPPVEPATPAQLPLADFVDPDADPTSYVKRYVNEEEYFAWFHATYPEYVNVCDAVGLEPDCVETYNAGAGKQAVPACGPGTVMRDGKCVAEKAASDDDDGEGGGGCLIATAAYGTELAPHVQHLRELRDSSLLQTSSGSSFMSAFNAAYYALSPAVADLERQSPAFRESVRLLITPMILSVHAVMSAAPGGAGGDGPASEASILLYGAASLVLVAGMYVAAPALAARAIHRAAAARRRAA